LQITDAPVEFPQFLLPVYIFGVFRSIAFGRGRGQGPGYLFAALPETFKFNLQALITPGCDIG
jgi:hypothetical protein